MAPDLTGFEAVPIVPGTLPVGGKVGNRPLNDPVTARPVCRVPSIINLSL
jgi:hypothetical protein